MATIKISGRKDPFIIPNEKAAKLKVSWLSASVPRSTKVDLGSWAGELGQIKDIKIEDEINYNTNYDQSAYVMSPNEWMAKDLNGKVAYGIEWFKFMLHGRTIDDPGRRNLSDGQKSEVKNILAKFYTATPKDPLPAPELFGELLPPRAIRKRGFSSIAQVIAST